LRKENRQNPACAGKSPGDKTSDAVKQVFGFDLEGDPDPKTGHGGLASTFEVSNEWGYDRRARDQGAFLES